MMLYLVDARLRYAYRQKDLSASFAQMMRNYLRTPKFKDDLSLNW